MGEGGNFQRTLAILLFSLVCWWAKGNPYFCAKNNFKINRINLSLHIHCTVQMSFLKMKDGEERKLESPSNQQPHDVADQIFGFDFLDQGNCNFALFVQWWHISDLNRGLGQVGGRRGVGQWV